jgi:hypothetical protein
MIMDRYIEIQAKNIFPDLGQTVSVPIVGTGPYCAWIIK